MALLGGGNQNCRIEENLHDGLCFQNRLDALLAHVLKKAFPLCSWLWDTLVHPQTIDIRHGGLLFDPLEKYTVGLLNGLQFRVRLKA